jgi:bacillithiol biosynthesis cysteine-adding enzyme BshC
MTDVRIITESLGGSPLSQLLQRGAAPAAWVAHAPRSAAEWRERAAQRAREREWEECWSTLEPAFAATGAAAERIARVRREGGVVVTTGQQPGLFGGPIYTWSKAMGALALADAIERETGIATVPVFWAATDDADFAEASYTVLARAGGADKVRSDNAPAAGTPMSLAPLGDLTHELHRLRDAAGSASDPRSLVATQPAYGDPARTVGDAYVMLLRELLTPLGVAVLDASHKSVRLASDQTLRNALRRAAVVGKSLADRSKELRDANFEPQVEDVKGLSLVFAREGSIKRRLTVLEAVEVAEDPDVWLSPNVLLRPIVEHAILPTVAYVAGPGELSYFAQTSAVADAMGVNRPLAVPRWSCTLIEPPVQRLLDAFHITPDVLARPDVFEGVVARSAMSTTSAEALRNLRAAIDAMPGALAAETDPLGLDRAVQGAMQSLQHRVDRLERRLVAGIKRRERDLLRDVGTLRGALYPLGTRQERALNFIPVLSRHGLGLLSEMRDAAAQHAQSLIERAGEAHSA